MGIKASLGTPSNLVQTIVLTGALWNLSREIQFHIQLPVQKHGTGQTGSTQVHLAEEEVSCDTRFILFLGSDPISVITYCRTSLGFAAISEVYPIISVTPWFPFRPSFYRTFHSDVNSLKISDPSTLFLRSSRKQLTEKKICP